jgi:hypothetical protein
MRLHPLPTSAFRGGLPAIQSSLKTGDTSCENDSKDVSRALKHLRNPQQKQILSVRVKYPTESRKMRHTSPATPPALAATAI